MNKDRYLPKTVNFMDETYRVGVAIKINIYDFFQPHFKSTHGNNKLVQFP